MASSLSEPSPRYSHYSAAVGGQLYVWGGHTKDFSKGNSELAVSVHSFNQYLETWQTRATTGKHPPALYSGSCTTSGHHLYLYGGVDGQLYHDSLYQLDTDSLEWSQLPNGPMRKSGSGMVSYEDKLILFGGYGPPSGPTQPGAQFIKKGRFTESRGWTNELHMFDVQKGEGQELHNREGLFDLYEGSTMKSHFPFAIMQCSSIHAHKALYESIA